MVERKDERLLDRITSLKILDKKGPLRQFFGSHELTAENLSEEQQRLAHSFREGIAQAIGVPTEYIKKEPIHKWIINFTQAFVKPEFLKETIAPSPRLMKIRGQELGTIIRESIEKIELDQKQEKSASPPEPVLDKQQPIQQPQGVSRSVTPIDQ